MSSYRKRSKCAEVPPVSEGYEAERYYDQEDGLFMNMPAE